MNLYTRIGMYLFIIGALLSVLDSQFTVAAHQGIIYIILIITGIFAGILNVTEDEEHHFLLAAGVFLLIVLSFTSIFDAEGFAGELSLFFRNSVVFVGSMALAVAVRSILEYGSQNYRVSHRESLDLTTKRIEEWHLSPWMRAWHLILFLTVALTFLIVLLGSPLYDLPDPLLAITDKLDWLIVAVFAADLVILYREQRSAGAFFKNCWVDIIAALPFQGTFFRAIKVVRLARIARVARISHTAKFFSQESGVNTYLRKSGFRTEPVAMAEHPKEAREAAQSGGEYHLPELQQSPGKETPQQASPVISRSVAAVEPETVAEPAEDAREKPEAQPPAPDEPKRKPVVAKKAARKRARKKGAPSRKQPSRRR